METFFQTHQLYERVRAKAVDQVIRCSSSFGYILETLWNCVIWSANRPKWLEGIKEKSWSRIINHCTWIRWHDEQLCWQIAHQAYKVRNFRFQIIRQSKNHFRLKWFPHKAWSGWNLDLALEALSFRSFKVESRALNEPLNLPNNIWNQFLMNSLQLVQLEWPYLVKKFWRGMRKSLRKVWKVKALRFRLL